MSRPSPTAVVRALLDRHGRTFCDELKIPIARGTPSPLFRWLCASILMSARIGHKQALSAAKALADVGWTTPRKMAESTWEQRVRVLNRSGYARYDESTSRMLGDDLVLITERYRGDLRRLRDAAGRDSRREHELLQEFKGIGEVGADIFCREAQLVWNELFPFADRRTLDAAKTLGLPADANRLVRLVARKDFPRLLAAIIRTKLEKDHEAVLEAARRGER